jgi:hypothetical protein
MFLGVHVGLTFTLTVKGNLNLDPRSVYFLVIVICTRVLSALKLPPVAYTTRDVVFDENIFPFTKLHPNAGAKLRVEILLLSPSLIPSDTSQGVNIIGEPVTNLPNQESQIPGAHSGVQVAANNGVQIALPVNTSPDDDSTQRVQPPATTAATEIHEYFPV